MWVVCGTAVNLVLQLSCAWLRCASGSVAAVDGGFSNLTAGCIVKMMDPSTFLTVLWNVRPGKVQGNRGKPEFNLLFTLIRSVWFNQCLLQNDRRPIQICLLLSSSISWHPSISHRFQDSLTTLVLVFLFFFFHLASSEIRCLRSCHQTFLIDYQLEFNERLDHGGWSALVMSHA
jgi:hypothetical protein